MIAVVSMFRAMNVGAHNRVKMDALRALYGELGFSNVASYIQSGNLAFNCKAVKLPKLAERIDQAIVARFGFTSEVVLRTGADMTAAVGANPFAGRDFDPAKLLVLFPRTPPAESAMAAVQRVPRGLEEIVATGQELYLYFPDGLARPKLNLKSVERALGVPATGRNWNTVLKLHEMVSGLGTDSLS